MCAQWNMFFASGASLAYATDDTMYNVDAPTRQELPSSRTLLRSTLIAAAVAAVLLVTVVLPAEYGVDPTGVGQVIGLTEMGEIKMELAREAAAVEAAAGTVPAQTPAIASTEPPAALAPVSAGETSPAPTSDEVSVTLTPGQGREIKLEMLEGASVQYTWVVEGGVVNSDTHGDRPGLSYHGYAKGTAQASDEGVLVAAFDGMHGWFWRNRGRDPVTVVLRTTGEYRNLHEVE
jgi:hypothetical protein